MNNKQAVIPENITIARLEQFEQMREFMIQIWRDNPQLLALAGKRAQMIMTDASSGLDHHSGHLDSPSEPSYR